ncbi:MAG: hypothetical protein N2Z76_07505 [Treponemataceae bacterium]|nr:hypothetical protein [Treponemataceae bacterium]
MRQLVFVLIALLAVVTFIRAFDTESPGKTGEALHRSEIVGNQ